MAGLDIGIRTVLSSTPAVGQAVGVAQDHPEISRSISEDASIERLRKETKEVLKTDKISSDLAVKEEDAEKQQQAWAEGDDAEQKEDSREKATAEEFNDNPWSGHIINKRI